MKRLIPSFLLVFIGLCSLAQNALKSYQWRDHLPYNQVYSVTNQGNKIFAVANECAFSYNKNDGSYDRLNKIYGYSDIEPGIIKNNPYNNAVLIIYKNSNIDVLKGGVITNVPDLFRIQNIGDKTVSSVTFSGKLAYLACGFGIAVFDTETFEFKDKYIIGPNATNLFVYQVAVSSTDIFAATKSGLFQASLTSPNLSSFTSWNKVSAIPAGPYNGVVYFGGSIITNFSRFIQSNQTLLQDTLYKFDGVSWSKFSGKPYIMAPGGSYAVSKLSVSDDNAQFITVDQWGFEAFDNTGATVGRIWGLPDGNYHTLIDVIPDPTEAKWYWLADPGYGLIKAESQINPAIAQAMQSYQINGPPSSGASSMAIKDNKIIVAPSFLDLGMFNVYNQYFPYDFTDNTWKQAKKHDTTGIFDITTIVFDRHDKNHYYAGAYWNGVVEFMNDSEIARYDYTNTAGQLHQTDYANSTLTRVGGLCVDHDNNLWAGMGDSQHLLSVKKAGTSTWTSLDFSTINTVNGSPGALPRVSQVIIDTNKQVWALAYGVGLFVYKYDGTNFTQPNPSNAKKITSIAGQGGLASNEVISIAEDKNNDIWVGTDKGISVFYSPESVIPQSTGWDAQPIYITQDGKTQLLLQTDEVSSITVDGANNKWCGTRSSGLYCFSGDGQKQLYHFTTDNSPLFSNAIVDVKINPQTGEVFIVTDKGILSFQNIITEGNENFNHVYAYPNPVKPNYDGPILIHGMINGATVKILDVAGNFVYETTAKGGQALWEGKNFSGQRVATGVYIVLCTTSDGGQKVMTKILLLN
ncbi:MAG TPA: two-component regulator propeller domain-containing protein [Bacteroidia bacterium]|jgi:hypothetical protein|nr:two-component regulator propeller domain-containing protein [Bacteroidia bacterium]